MLGRAASENNRALDAIVVPASRPAYNLDHAITLARAAHCHLVILCSRDTHAAEVHDLLAVRSFSAATIIEMPPRYNHDFFKFETTEWIKRRLPNRDSDLSVKRNVGLVLARMLGWKRIFFMDDDIRDLGATALLSTAAMLADGQPAEQRYYSAGMSAAEFPDNSVVCHARRAIGEYQDVFISGSALAVDCTASFAFFPHIYNEDWLFFYRDAAEGRLGTSGHTATQLRYDPFADPRRAASQEFGDVIAEGLYALLDEGLGAEFATVKRWGQFLGDRKRILDEIIDRSDNAPQEIREKMTRAVAAARQCLKEIRPDMCVDYVNRWRRDLGHWEMTLKQVPEAAAIPDALGKLGLVPAVAEGDRSQERMLRALFPYHGRG
jgi:glycosyltransferase involved in cell wall biosynthesis